MKKTNYIKELEAAICLRLSSIMKEEKELLRNVHKTWFIVPIEQEILTYNKDKEFVRINFLPRKLSNLN